MIYADQRWIGDHGIGRFAHNVLSELEYRPVPLRSHPAAPLDALRLSRALSGLTRKDLFFSPGYNTPLFLNAPFIFTICDLSHIHCPENSSPLIRLYYATIMKRACHRARSILTISEFTRAQIINWSGVPPGKVVNVQCGVDPSYAPGSDTYGLPFPYLLCVSNRKPHKNELRLVEAFAKARIDPRIHLVFTGRPSADLARCTESKNLGERVDVLGVVPEAKLPSLYRGAEALIFPSLYEGFALPVLEAMACGTPVVSSNTTAIPELAGDSALLVNPVSVEEIAAAIEQIVTDISLRARLREKGLARAAQYSWNSTAGRVHDLLAANNPEPERRTSVVGAS
jgi:glycosyltransferase involved in cell wall biosynthesis